MAAVCGRAAASVCRHQFRPGCENETVLAMWAGRHRRIGEMAFSSIWRSNRHSGGNGSAQGTSKGKSYIALEHIVSFLQIKGTNFCTLIRSFRRCAGPGGPLPLPDAAIRRNGRMTPGAGFRFSLFCCTVMPSTMRMPSVSFWKSRGPGRPAPSSHPKNVPFLRGKHEQTCEKTDACRRHAGWRPVPSFAADASASASCARLPASGPAKARTCRIRAARFGSEQGGRHQRQADRADCGRRRGRSAHGLPRRPEAGLRRGNGGHRTYGPP